MAKYNIKQLNYIACGASRNFVNMDLELGYEVPDYVHLLCAEVGSKGYPDIESWRKKLSSDISVDIGTEHGDGRYYPSDYIYRNRDTPLSKERDAEGVILNEEQSHYVEKAGSNRKYIRLFLSCCTIQMLERITRFNRDREMPNRTYLLENTPNDKNNLTCGGQIMNAYDIRDVSIKRLGRHQQYNSALVGHTQQYPNGGTYELTHHDIYAPNMNGHPIGFCQSNTQGSFDSDAVVLTRGSTNIPTYFESDMESNRGLESNRQHYDMQLTKQTAKAYTYRPYSDGYQLSDVCVPVRSYDGASTSFVIDVPVDQQFHQNSVTSDYDAGEIYYRRLMTCKNLYDNVYSMRMPYQNKISAARTYCGIGSCAGQTYLKYWDDVNYGTVSSHADSGYIQSQWVVSSNSFDDSRYTTVKPYQKIEYLYPTDHNQSAKHKSNVFSVEILSTGIGSMEDEQRGVAENPDASESERSTAEAKLAKLDTLKRDITAAVRDIVRNITPANTQLFDVYFVDN